MISQSSSSRLCLDYGSLRRYAILISLFDLFFFIFFGLKCLHGVIMEVALSWEMCITLKVMYFTSCNYLKQMNSTLVRCSKHRK